jgi:hypothetical protein
MFFLVMERLLEIGILIEIMLSWEWTRYLKITSSKTWMDLAWKTRQSLILSQGGSSELTEDKLDFVPFWT